MLKCRGWACPCPILALARRKQPAARLRQTKNVGAGLAPAQCAKATRQTKNVGAGLAPSNVNF